MREKWIENIKFFASFVVLLTHLFSSFAVVGAGKPQWLDRIKKFPFAMVLNEELWVIIFALLSGYLINKKNIEDGRNLAKACVNRYFRFLIPFFFANLFIYMLDFRHMNVGK